MGIEAMAAVCTDATPFADEQGMTEEVRPDLEAIVAVLLPIGQRADEGCRFRKQRELDWSGP